MKIRKINRYHRKEEILPVRNLPPKNGKTCTIYQAHPKEERYGIVCEDLLTNAVQRNELNLPSLCTLISAAKMSGYTVVMIDSDHEDSSRGQYAINNKALSYLLREASL